MFYGGTQPATVIETYPSVHCLLRLSIELCFSPQLRSRWFKDALKNETTCFVGANKSEKAGKSWLYGIQFPGQVVRYGSLDMIGNEETNACICGRQNKVKHVIGD
jgi:hypothetical protein